MAHNYFHLGLCMAGSVSAGAYTAGVIDYLTEALANWEKDKELGSVPDHQVVIDLFGGASGGGIAAAMAMFGLQDKIDHVQLAADRRTYSIPRNNIYWNSWVELSGPDVFEQMLSTADIEPGFVPSLLNADFIDKVAEDFKKYILNLASRGGTRPPYLGLAPELFLTLFNVTGINYELFTTAATSSSSRQFITEHRDIAHFRLAEAYRNDGRMPLSLRNTVLLDTLVDAAKATGAFPGGLKARRVTRANKYIWENPFFTQGKFNKNTILLQNADDNGVYTSLNGDGGTANNEPVELARELLYKMLAEEYKTVEPQALEKLDEANKQSALKELHDMSVLLIDPFPSFRQDIKLPEERAESLPKYVPDLVLDLHSQLLFDANKALQAFSKSNYGLHIIAPSRSGVAPQFAIACGALGGFGGFLEREFRVHDYFLGRHNCQSFLRKYFVANLKESTDDPDYRCIQSVLTAYKRKPDAIRRFAFTDEKGVQYVPIIPDMALSKPIVYTKINGKSTYMEENVLPTYELQKLDTDHVQRKFGKLIAARYRAIATNVLPASGFLHFAIKLATFFTRNKVSGAAIEKINADFKKRGLVQ